MTTPRPTQHFERTLAQAASDCGGTTSGAPETRLRAVTTDSRDVPADALFVALTGERFDGHDFVGAAREAGAAAAMVHADVDTDLPCITVDDTLVGLGKLARAHRDRFDIPVIAITGSAGKSTTKEMIAAVLSGAMRVLKTTGNLNNRIGVPLTLFGLGEKHEAAVIEAGISLPGEMAHLREIIRPTVRVLTNAALSHVEFLVDAAGVAREKATLFDDAGPDDVIVYNADDPLVTAEAEARDGKKISFGILAGDVRASEIITGAASSTIEVTCDGNVQVLVVPAPGTHNVMNALAAAAVGVAVGLDLQTIARGLEKNYEPMPMRSRSVRLEEDIRLIDDTYNSNPASAKAALELLRLTPAKRRVAVLADMLELGEAAPDAHRELGRWAGTFGADIVVTFGELARHTHEAASGAGATSEHFDDRAACAARVAGLVKPGDAVLVKGSRGMRMEEVVAALLAKHPEIDEVA